MRVLASSHCGLLSMIGTVLLSEHLGYSNTWWPGGVVAYVVGFSIYYLTLGRCL